LVTEEARSHDLIGRDRKRRKKRTFPLSINQKLGGESHRFRVAIIFVIERREEKKKLRSRVSKEERRGEKNRTASRRSDQSRRRWAMSQYTGRQEEGGEGLVSRRGKGKGRGNNFLHSSMPLVRQREGQLAGGNASAEGKGEGKLNSAVSRGKGGGGKGEWRYLLVLTSQRGSSPPLTVRGKREKVIP